MPSLPYELLVMICGYLAIPELKNTRLASPTLSEICEKLLYRHIVLKPNVESFRRLDLISNHPRYCHYIESLDCCGQPLYYNISEISRRAPAPAPLHHKSTMRRVRDSDEKNREMLDEEGCEDQHMWG